MRRVTLLFAAFLLGLAAALLPAAAMASSSLVESVTGVEYAVGTCPGGDTGSFAGTASPSAVFNTTICHTALTSKGTATILAGGSFELATTQRLIVGQYTGGSVGPGVVSPLGFFCKEAFPVVAYLGPTSSVPKGAKNIIQGSAQGFLTHFGVLTPAGGCSAFAATITGTATLSY